MAAAPPVNSYRGRFKGGRHPHPPPPRDWTGSRPDIHHIEQGLQRGATVSLLVRKGTTSCTWRALLPPAEPVPCLLSHQNSACAKPLRRLALRGTAEVLELRTSDLWRPDVAKLVAALPTRLPLSRPAPGGSSTGEENGRGWNPTEPSPRRSPHNGGKTPQHTDQHRPSAQRRRTCWPRPWPS
jgi:hypothetical protein